MSAELNLNYLKYVLDETSSRKLLKAQQMARRKIDVQYFNSFEGCVVHKMPTRQKLKAILLSKPPKINKYIFAFVKLKTAPEAPEDIIVEKNLSLI